MAAAAERIREHGRRELARRLALHEKEVRRMLDPRHKTKLPRMDAAMRVLGKGLVVEDEAA